MRAMLGLSVLAMACGGGDGNPAVSARQQAIVGGVEDPGDDAVAAVVVAGFAACTATLVAPNVALTAGHCANVLGATTKQSLAFGPDAKHPTRTAAIAEQRAHPQYTREGAPYDFALFRLAAPVAGIAPLALGTAPLTEADVGRTVRHVGYGVFDEATGEGMGTKRQASFPITKVEPTLVWSNGVGQQTCNGDSGGPALLLREGHEEVVGVVSDGPSCHEPGWDGRVDVVADWVQLTLREWAPAAADAGAEPAPAPRQGCATSGGSAPASMLVVPLLLAARRRQRGVAAPG